MKNALRLLFFPTFLYFLPFVVFSCFPIVFADFSQSVINVVEQNISQQRNQNLSRVVWMEVFRRLGKSRDASSETKKIALSIASHLFSGISVVIQGAYDEFFRKSFLDLYGSGITNPNLSLPSRCFDEYIVLDLISRAMDIPTPLTIATWKMEADCKYGPYKNGPFQLMSYTYPTGKNDYTLFIRQVIDFALFTKHKWNLYAKANAKSGLHVDMNYAYWTFDAIVKHGALYNGLSGKTIVGDIQPLQREYVWGNFGVQNSGAKKDGLIANFLKVLYREQENRKRVYEEISEFLQWKD